MFSPRQTANQRKRIQMLKNCLGDPIPKQFFCNYVTEHIKVYILHQTKVLLLHPKR